MAKVGRPRMYNTKEEIQIKIDEYFNTEVNESEPPTVAGLALFLGFCDRKSLYEYKENNEFTHTIKSAVSKIEQFAEKQLMNGKGGSGAIFWLKNHGWSDKQEIDHTTKGDKIQPFNIQVSSEKTKEEIKKLSENN